MNTKSQRRTAAEIRSELEDARQAAKRLQERINFYKQRLAHAEAELQSLVGSGLGRSSGRISKLKSDLEDAERWESDQSARIVVWERMPFSDCGEKIVSRVTPKRIYVRSRGGKRESQFKRDGSSISDYAFYGKIDVAATLGGDLTQ